MVKGLKEPKLRFSEYRGTEGWEKVKLGGVIEVAPKSKRKASEGSVEGVYPFFTNSTTDSKQFIDESDLAGKYVIANTGGKAYFEYIDGEFSYMGDCFVFTSETINPRFLFDLLKYKTDYINELGFTGSGLKHLDKEWFNNLKLFVPKGVLEQQKIGEFFSLLDQKINLQSEKIQNLTLYKKGLLQQVMSREIRFKDSEGREYPEWGKDKLGKICDLSSSKRVHVSDYVEDGIPFYRGKEISELNKGMTPSELLYISQEHYEDIKNKYGIPMKNDILITAVGTIGNTWLIDTDEPFYYKDGNLILLSNIEINPEYLNVILKSSIIQKEINNISLGSNQKALTMVKLREIDILVPCKEEQQKIASLFSTIDKKIESEQQKLELLKEQKKGLMQQMFI